MKRTLFAILFQAGLKREEILDLDEREVIRLEKKLKANQELWEGVSPEETERVTEALKRHLPQVKQFYSNELLYELLHGHDIDPYDYAPFFQEGEELERAQAFFTAYFEEEVLEQFKQFLSEERFLTLANWQLIQQLFSVSLRHALKEMLIAHLQLILSVLEEKPRSKQLIKRIPFATNPHFFILLDKIREPEFEEIIASILRFYTENASYTRGRHFTHELLSAIRKYKPEDDERQAIIALIEAFFGGTVRRFYYKIGIIALILGVFFLYALSAFLPKENKAPVAFVPKTSEERKAYAYRQEIRRDELNSYRSYHSYIRTGDSCPGSPVPVNETVEFTTPAEYSRKLTELLSTGENVGKGMTSRIEDSDSNFRIVNNTQEHLFAFIYVSTCKTASWGYLPCEDPGFAYNRVYIAPADTLSIDYRVDSLAFQSGTQLYRIKEGSHYRNTSYEFCPVSKADSLLIFNTLIVPYPHRLLNGFLEFNESKGNYRLSWIGTQGAIFSRASGSYLESGKPSKRGKK